MNIDKLETELATYEQHKKALLSSSAGKFVLIHGERLIDTFDTELDAVRQGYRTLGNIPFLVKQIVEVERPLYFTSNLIPI